MRTTFFTSFLFLLFCLHGLSQEAKKNEDERIQIDSVYCLAYSPKGDYLVAGCEDGTIHVYETKKWKEVFSEKAHRGEVNGIAFSPDGRFFSSTYGKLKIWDIKTKKVVLELKAGGKDIGF